MSRGEPDGPLPGQAYDPRTGLPLAPPPAPYSAPYGAPPGFVARQQIAQRGESGDGIAIAGIVLGWIGVGVLALMLFVLFVGAAANGF
jgi:hypothetical protein